MMKDGGVGGGEDDCEVVDCEGEGDGGYEGDDYVALLLKLLIV